MAILPFNRNKSNDKVPSEVKQYYKSERRERVGIAWLLALGTLIATMVLAIGFFYGGRWAWRQIFDNESGQTATTETAQNQGEQPANNQPSSQPQTPQTNQPNPAPNSTPSQPQASAPSTPQVSAPTNPPARTERLAGTGPADTIAIFVGATILATLAHEFYTRRKLVKT